MGGGRVGQADEEMMKGAYDWAGEASSLHRCAVRVVLRTTPRRGVWSVRAQAVDVVEGRAVGVRAQVEIEWPSAHHQTLAGAVLNALMRLDHELGVDELQRGG